MQIKDYNRIKAGVLPEDMKLDDVNTVLDCMAEAMIEGCSGLIVPKACFPESFFDLKTGFAGEVLQKFSNYGMKLAVIGDFTPYTSNSLKALIIESNNGNLIFFKETEEEGLKSF